MFQKPIFGRKGAEAIKQITDFIAPSDHPELGGLNDELKRLDLFQKGLARFAVRFVATGTPAHFLKELAGITGQYQHNCYSSPYLKDSIATNAACGKSDIALAKGEITDPDIITRFVAIRRLVRPMVEQKAWNRPDYPDAEMPVREYYSALSQGDSRLNSHGADVKPKPDVVPTLSPRQVLKITQELGGDAALYFKCHGGYTLFSRRDHFKAEYTQLIIEHPQEFARAIAEQVEAYKDTTMFGLAASLDVLKLPPIMAQAFSHLGKGNTKDMRGRAIGALAKLELPILSNALALGLAEGELEMRFDLVQIAGLVGEEPVLEVLRAHLPNERSGKVKGAIDAILDTEELVAEEPVEPGEASGIKLVNGEVYELAPTDEALLAPPSDDERADFERLIGYVNALRDEARPEINQSNKGWREYVHPITPQECAELFALLQSNGERKDRSRHLTLEYDLKPFAISDDVRDWFYSVSFSLRWRTIIWLTSFKDLDTIQSPGYWDRGVVTDLFDAAIKDGADPLAIAALCDLASPKAGGGCGHVGLLRKAVTPYQSWYGRWENPLEKLPEDMAQRIVASGLSVFDEVFGLARGQNGGSVPQACALLGMLPAVPERYVPKMIEAGLTGKKADAEAVQQVLHNAGGVADRLVEALDDRRQDVRAGAATWLADLRAEASEKAMRKRLKKEKAEKVRAALIEALLRLGADLSDVIGPDALVAEAEKKGTKLSLPEWLERDVLPQVRFADGSAAPRALVEYWIALAVKLKDPGNTGLFGIYLDQLLPEDAKALSGVILQGWIDFDTFGPSNEEANAYAQQYADSQYQSWSRYNAEITRESVFATLKRRKLSEMPNTGTKTKGILALACRAEPAFAAERVRWFLKKHGRRSHQAMALLDMLAGINSPSAMQVVIAAATRLKQKSTMAHANAIAERYAKDRGWTYDQLADRTVPTAGFGDDGVLELPCGLDEKPYSARLDAELKVHISNPDGKVIKALPAGDDDATKESKKTLSAAKRELKQIIDMQTRRLIEAMAAGRVWPVEDWVECFNDHPVMRRLIERLVWEGLDDEGKSQGLLRPTQDGDVTDADDNEVDVKRYAQIRLSHAALVDAEAAKAWRAHLKDYEVKPLIDQFPKDYEPFGGEEPDATAISDRLGWLGDSRAFRGAAEKLGYQREIGDGGGCVGYYKTFEGAGVTALIQTEGGLAVDENMPQALKDLIFRKAGTYQTLPLEEVPPVLLALCHADLHVVAKKGKFEEDWEKKAGW